MTAPAFGVLEAPEAVVVVALGLEGEGHLASLEAHRMVITPKTDLQTLVAVSHLRPTALKSLPTVYWAIKPSQYPPGFPTAGAQRLLRALLLPKHKRSTLHLLVLPAGTVAHLQLRMDRRRSRPLFQNPRCHGLKLHG